MSDRLKEIESMLSGYGEVPRPSWQMQMRWLLARFRELEAERDELLRAVSDKTLVAVDLAAERDEYKAAMIRSREQHHDLMYCIQPLEAERDRLREALKGARTNTWLWMDLDPVGYQENGFAVENINEALAEEVSNG